MNKKSSILTIKSSDLEPSRHDPARSKLNSKPIPNENWAVDRDEINKKSRLGNEQLRPFNTFDFLKCQKSNTCNDDDDDDICIVTSSINPRVERSDEDWYEFSAPLIGNYDPVKIRFSNARDIQLWPSEEIMAYFCLKNSVIFEDKSICELGGSMTCLSGLMISKYSQSNEVFLTNSDDQSFENLELICSQNEFRCTVECCLLQWSSTTNYADLEDRFDYVLCTDCLFTDEQRKNLCTTIWKLLKMDGICLVFAPIRQNSFHKFVDMAKLHFQCMIVHDYDVEVWERHLWQLENNDEYEEDVHYPLLLKLKKRNITESNVAFCKMVL